MNRFKALFILLVMIVSAILILYGINVFPVTGTDSRVFIPTALLYSRGFGFTNPYYDISFVTGLTHFKDPFLFNYYVPFFPMLLGTLSRVHTGTRTIFIICSLISVSALLLYCRTIASVLPHRLSLSSKAIALCSITYIATFLLPTVGRPENVTVLLVFLIYLLYNKRGLISGVIYNLLICAVFSMILASQIICFYFCFLFFIIYELINSVNVYKTVLVNTLRVVAIALLFFIILSASPIGFISTIKGINMHAAWALSRSDRSIRLFIYYWLFAPLNFGFLFIFLACAVFYIRGLFIHFKGMAPLQAAMVIMLQLMLLYGLAKFVFYASPTVYNATQFILPLSVFLAVNILSLNKTTVNKALKLLTMATYLAGTFVFLRWFVLFIDYKIDGKDYTAARPIINRMAQQNKNVYVTVNLWALADDPYQVKLYNGTNNKKGDIIIVQQVYLPYPENILKNCTILYDWRTTKNRKILGIPLSNTPQNYGFIIGQLN